jgi:hypothetical protein
MTPLPAVPGVIKVEWLWSQDGIPAANVLHVGYSGGPPVSGDLNTLATALVAGWWTGPTAELWSSETTFMGMRLTDLSSDTGAVGEEPVEDPGTNTEGVMPAQACTLINFQIVRRYRGGHPRMYLPAPAFGFQDGPAAWLSTYLTAVTTAFGGYVAATGVATAGDTDLTGPVNVSYVSGGDVRVDPVVDSITGFSVNGVVATQRRRIRASSY